jgi:nicotinamide-nucleotide amidase
MRKEDSMSLASDHEFFTNMEREQRERQEILDLSQQVGALLKEKGLSIAVAESLTSGNVQAALGGVSGSSAYYRGGLTAYTATAKAEILGIDRMLLSDTNCVHPHVARKMAEGVAEMFKANIGIGTTGYAEPDPDHDAPTPKVYWHIHFPTGPLRGHEKLAGLSRLQVQKDVVQIVLRALLMALLAIPKDGP